MKTDKSNQLMSWKINTVTKWRQLTNIATSSNDVTLPSHLTHVPSVWWWLVYLLMLNFDTLIVFFRFLGFGSVCWFSNFSNLFNSIEPDFIVLAKRSNSLQNCRHVGFGMSPCSETIFWLRPAGRHSICYMPTKLHNDLPLSRHERYKEGTQAADFTLCKLQCCI